MHNIANNVECTTDVTSKTIEFNEESSPFTCGTYTLDGSSDEYHDIDDPRPTIQIDVIVDFNCVWCLLAKKALDNAIKMSSDRFRFELAYRPFILFESLPVGEGVPLTKLLEYSPCTRDVFMNPDSPMHRNAALLNLRVVPERIRISNSLDTHRLVCLMGYALKHTSQNRAGAVVRRERDMCFGRNSSSSNNNTTTFLAHQTNYNDPIMPSPRSLSPSPSILSSSQSLNSTSASSSHAYSPYPSAPSPSHSLQPTATLPPVSPAHINGIIHPPLPSLPPLHSSFDPSSNSQHRQTIQLPPLFSAINRSNGGLNGHGSASVSGGNNSHHNGGGMYGQGMNGHGGMSSSTGLNGINGHSSVNLMNGHTNFSNGTSSHSGNSSGSKTVLAPYIQSRQFDMIDYILHALLEGAPVYDLDFLAETGEKFGLGPASTVKEFLSNRENLTACIMDNYRSIRDRFKIKGVPFFVVGIRPPATPSAAPAKNNQRMVISGGDVRPETFLQAFRAVAEAWER